MPGGIDSVALGAGLISLLGRRDHSTSGHRQSETERDMSETG